MIVKQENRPNTYFGSFFELRISCSHLFSICQYNTYIAFHITSRTVSRDLNVRHLMTQAPSSFHMKMLLTEKTIQAINFGLLYITSDISKAFDAVDRKEFI